MEKKKISFVSVFVVVVMLAAIFMPIGSVIAPGGRQHNIWGYAEDGPDPGSTGSTYGGVISAWIDGVSYGANITSPINASFDLYVDGDVWGVPEDDAVKDGGYEGDLIYYFLDYDPMDYFLNISTTTSYHNYTAYQQVDPMYFDTETWTDPGIPGDTFLRGLKINEVVVNPTSGNQYVYLYDPGGELNEAALEHLTQGYYLQKDDSTGHTPDGPIFDFNAQQSYVTQVPTTNYYFIELAGFTLNQADELKLVWKNPGTSHQIANNTDVIVDRVEWGNYVNYIDLMNPPNDRDYDNTTLLDCPGITTTGESYKRTPNGTDSDNCASDLPVGPATPPYIITPYEEPGAPTDLTVHKGPYMGKGTLNDLVLYWKAPGWKWDKLVANIVYYDTDLSNGFQYTLWYEFATNSTTSAGDDWCVLPGFLADSNNYALIVHTTGDTKGSYENMTGSNIGYKNIMILQKNPAPGSTQFKWISIPYFCDYTKASDIAGVGVEFTDNTKIDTLVKWNFTIQEYDRWVWTPFPPPAKWAGKDFTINPGDSLGVIITTDIAYEWKIVGSYDDTLEIVLQKNPTPGMTQFKTASLPYHRAYEVASDIAGVGKEFFDNSIIDTIVQWNFTLQEYDRWVWTPFPPPPQWAGKDFTINTSPGDALGFIITSAGPYLWKPQVITL